MTTNEMKKINDANEFRDMLLRLNGVSIQTFGDAEILLRLISKNFMTHLDDMNKLVFCFERLKFNLLLDFGVAFFFDITCKRAFFEDALNAVDMCGSADWREFCAKCQDEKEQLIFGKSDVNIETWTPQGYNF